MAIHFISDLHLSDNTPPLNRLFLKTLQDWASHIDALYILGDLFEYWVGDDDDSSFLEPLLAAMRSFSDTRPLYVMCGNRDFLLGEGFCLRSGAQLLHNLAMIEVHGHRCLLSHGDELCTGDFAYQQFRTLSRTPEWKKAMLARPLKERHAIAQQARQQSESAKQEHGLIQIHDVDTDTIEMLLAAYGWPTLIHGHTHRPAVHRHGLSERWVIQDWHGTQGGYLRLDGKGIVSLPLSAV